MSYLEDYYNQYDEEGRLLSPHGKVEYLTTMKYIQACLSELPGTIQRHIGQAGISCNRGGVGRSQSGTAESQARRFRTYHRHAGERPGSVRVSGRFFLRDDAAGADVSPLHAGR